MPLETQVSARPNKSRAFISAMQLLEFKILIQSICLRAQLLTPSRVSMISTAEKAMPKIKMNEELRLLIAQNPILIQNWQTSAALPEEAHKANIHCLLKLFNLRSAELGIENTNMRLVDENQEPAVIPKLIVDNANEGITLVLLAVCRT